MLTSKKELLKINEEIASLNKRVEQQLQVMSSQKTELLNQQQHSVNSITLQIDTLNEKGTYLSQRFAQEVEQITNLKDEMKKSVDAFRMMGNITSNKLLDQAALSIKREVEKLKLSSQKYQQLEEQMVQTQHRIMVVEKQLSKFLEIAQQIKAADFKLSKFAEQVTKADQEKLQLMKENEKLKALIARERRKK